MAERQLTTKQKAFVENRLKGMNGVDSAREAGYKGSYNVLNAVAVENLQKPVIKNELAKRKAEIEAKTDYNVEMWRQNTIKQQEMAISVGNFSAAANYNRQLGEHKGVFEADNSQKRTQLAIALRNEQVQIDKQIATAQALDQAPDALAT